MRNSNISAKKKFSILIKLMKNSKKSQSPPLIEGEKAVSDPQEKSDLFNTYFSSKSTVPNPDDSPPHLEQLEGIPIMDSINTSPIEISKIIRTGLKKSYISHCGISGKFLNFIASPIAKSMSKLFNNFFLMWESILISGKFPMLPLFINVLVQNVRKLIFAPLRFFPQFLKYANR